MDILNDEILSLEKRIARIDDDIKREAKTILERYSEYRLIEMAELIDRRNKAYIELKKLIELKTLYAIKGDSK